MTVIDRILRYGNRKLVKQEVHIAPLVSFRIIFGLLMLFSVIRFALNGWIHQLYIEPSFFFPYLGFEWIRPLSPEGMYAVFFIMGCTALCIAIGYFYRLATILFFLSFTYVELIDKTNYLNHYYFVSLVAFLLIFVPAHRYFSVDVWRTGKRVTFIQAGYINIFRLQLGIVYFFAGIAKINYAWLIQAQPLKMWLSSLTSKPVIGGLLKYKVTAYLFSWFGMLYDITVPFLLSYRMTRLPAYIAVVVFHLMTWYLFPIGVFPWVMIFSTLIFFPERYHRQILEKMESIVPGRPVVTNSTQNPGILIKAFFILFFVVQALIPLRYTLYPGNVFWTEEGYRFSWRVMLMEKAGYALFKVHDGRTGKSVMVAPYQYLTAQQEKMMATQPDMMVQFARFLKEEFRSKGFVNPRVTVESYVTLNGSPSKLFIDSDFDLAGTDHSLRHKDWILSYE